MGTERLIGHINENSFSHRSIEIKKINVQIETPDKKSSFRANLKSRQGEFALLSINKLAVPAAKIMLEPDSIKLINYIDKYWMTDSYDYIESILNIGIKFDDIQAIIFDDILYFQGFANFVSYTDSGYYVIKSIVKDNESHIVKFLYVDPENYKIRKVIIDNEKQNERVVINFSEYNYLGGQLYPGAISLDYKGETFLKISVKLSGAEINKVAPTFVIPTNYKKM